MQYSTVQYSAVQCSAVQYLMGFFLNFPGLLKRQVTIFTNILLKELTTCFGCCPVHVCLPTDKCCCHHKTPNYGFRSLCLQNSSLCPQSNYSMFLKTHPSGVCIPIAPLSLLLPHWPTPTKLLPQVLLPQGVSTEEQELVHPITLHLSLRL